MAIMTSLAMKSSTCAFAQDLILTTEDKIIEAIIHKITSECVTYKTYDNPDGPLHEIKKSRILRISFDNSLERATVTGGNVQPRPEKLMYSRGKVYLNNQELRNYEMSTLLTRNVCMSIYGGKKMYKHGRNLIIAGSLLEFSALVLFLNGIIDDSPLPLALARVTSLSGIPCLGAGIPIYCVGKHRIRNAVASYNESNGYGEFALNIGSTRNGIGLHLNF